MGIPSRRTGAWRTCSIAFFAASFVLLLWPRTAAAETLNIHDFGSGAVAAYSNCELQPNDDYLCDDFIVEYYMRAGASRIGTLFVEHFRAFIHPDGTADEVVAEIGFADVPGYYDRARLAFAGMSGATLDFNDVDPVTFELTPNGRTVTVGPFEWTAASGVYVFGSDGPWFGPPHLYVDRCVTQVQNGHNRFATAHVTGTIDGVSVDNFGPSFLPWPGTGPGDALGAIFDNRINVVIASHVPGC